MHLPLQYYANYTAADSDHSLPITLGHTQSSRYATCDMRHATCDNYSFMPKQKFINCIKY